MLRPAVGVAFAASLLLSSVAAGSGTGPADVGARRAKRADAVEPAPARSGSWSALAPKATADVAKKGAPLVTYIVVPLCSNDQIDCGAAWAGRPGDLSKNLYWGAVFGQRHFFDRPTSGFTRVEVTRPPGGSDDPLLERVVYKREVSRSHWSSPGAGDPDSVEQIVIFQAVHGAAIDRAVALFWKLATEGGRVRFNDGGRERDLPIHVAGYAGHNRLMDGVALPPPPPKDRASPIPSFVIACYSESYFGGALRRAGSEPLLMTRSLMAPEGYVLDAVTRALGENTSRPEIRARAIAAYAKWQRLSTSAASTIFAPSPR